MKNLSIAFSLLVLLASCGKEEVPEEEEVKLSPAEFVLEGDPNVSIDYKFTSTTKGSAYKWDFGDGTTSNKKSVWHTFPTRGDYTVTLEVTTDEGQRLGSKSVSVTADDKHLISKKWKHVSGTKNGEDYPDANGNVTQLYGNGVIFLGTLDFTWSFEDDNKVVVINYGSGYPPSRWNIIKLTAFEFVYGVDTDDGDKFTFTLHPDE